MQIIPSSWRVVGLDMDGDGVRDPQNIYDSAGAAMVYLCAGGRDLSTAAGLKEAVLSYNRSADYLRAVLAWTSVFEKADLTGMGAVPFVASLAVPTTSTPLDVSSPVPTSDPHATPTAVGDQGSPGDAGCRDPVVDLAVAVRFSDDRPDSVQRAEHRSVDRPVDRVARPTPTPTRALDRPDTAAGRGARPDTARVGGAHADSAPRSRPSRPTPSRCRSARCRRRPQRRPTRLPRRPTSRSSHRRPARRRRATSSTPRPVSSSRSRTARPPERGRSNWARSIANTNRRPGYSVSDQSRSVEGQ